ncbi:MAG TPA: SCO family protein [Methylomirabilota bacterium]|nr:SCO family protein [Methylomirabilota bacterium]
MTSRARTPLLAAIAAIAVSLVAPATWAHGVGGAPGRFDYTAPRPGTYTLPVIKPAADGAVLDASGTARRLRGVMDGRVTVLSFIYTRCSDANGCPLATAVLHELRAMAARDVALSARLKLVTLSFDVAHDRPAVLAKYGGRARAGRGPDWAFVVPTGERERDTILDAYGQTLRAPSAGEAGPSHLLRVYLIDQGGRIRNIYGLDFLDPRLLLNDVRTLLLEKREARR